MTSKEKIKCAYRYNSRAQQVVMSEYAQLIHNTAQNSSDNPSASCYPPDKH